MSKKNGKKLVIVDTIVSYKMRYVIECNEVNHSLDEITMIDSGNPEDVFEEISQKCLGETIFDHREITKKEFNDMIAQMKIDNEGSWWMGSDLIRKINYTT